MSQEIQIIIRPIKDEEIYRLEDFLYEAVFVLEGEEPVGKEVIEVPEIKVYIKDFGREDDRCLVAVTEKGIVGAVWTRILNGQKDEVKGYGNVDQVTPEFAISVLKAYRGRGIGTKLMKEMIQLLTEEGYKQASLSVDKRNYAFKMYKYVGFEVIKEQEDDYLMLIKL